MGKHIVLGNDCEEVKAFCKLLAEKGISYVVIGDPSQLIKSSDFEAAHVFLPFSNGDFMKQCQEFIRISRPRVTLIHSAVKPGTTKEVWEAVDKKFRIAYSPCRGQRDSFFRDLKRYSKYVSGVDFESHNAAIDCLFEIFEKVEPVNNIVELELAKLLDTSQYGLLIAWAQEMKRFCDMFNCSPYFVRKFGEQTNEFYALRPDIFPGFIANHEVIRNLYILAELKDSQLSRAAIRSNSSWEIEEGKDVYYD